MNIIFRAVAALIPLLLSACLSQTSAPSAAPTGFAVTEGENRVTLTWDSLPGMTYWVYYKAGTSVSKDDFTAISYNVIEPAVISGLTNGTEYAFLITASADNSKTGPASPVVTKTPRLISPAITWTPGSPLTSHNLNWITYGNTHFVTVGDAATVLSATHNYTGTGGVTTPPGWASATTLPIGFSADLTAVLYDGARFVAMGSDGSIITSTDTLIWTAGTAVGTSITGMHALAYGAGSYVAVGDGGAIYRNTTAGITGNWTPVTSGTSQTLYGVSYVNGIFVAVGANGTVLKSTDGTAWAAGTISPSITSDLHQVAYGASTYVAVGDAGTIVSSTDAASWTSENNSTTILNTVNLRTICFGPDAQFIAAGTAGNIAYSATGLEGAWQPSTAGVKDLNSIVPSDVFIAVGAAGANVSGK